MNIIAAMVPDGSDNTQLQLYTNSGGWAKTEDITQSSPGDNFRPFYVVNGAGRYTLLWFYTERYTATTTGNWESMRFAYPGFSNGKHIGLFKNAQTDFGDLRFTEDDGATLLGDAGQPWLPACYNVSSWRAWAGINCGTIPAAAGTLTVYLYYDHVDSDRTNDADQTVMDAVFKAGDSGAITADDFITTGSCSSDKWTITGSPSQTSSILSINASERLAQNLANFADITLPADIYVRWKGYDTTMGYAIFGLKDAAGNNVLYVFNDGTADEIGFQTGRVASTTSTYYLWKDIANYHTWRITWESGIAKIYWLGIGETSREPKLVATHTDPSQYVPAVDLYMDLYNTNANEAYVDWIFVKPWSGTGNDPIITPSAYGEEKYRRIFITSS